MTAFTSLGTDEEVEPGQVEQRVLASPHTNSYVVVPAGGVKVEDHVVTPVVALNEAVANETGDPAPVLT